MAITTSNSIRVNFRRSRPAETSAAFLFPSGAECRFRCRIFILFLSLPLCCLRRYVLHIILQTDISLFLYYTKKRKKVNSQNEKNGIFLPGEEGNGGTTNFPGQQAGRSCKTGNMVCLSAEIRTVLRFQKIDTRFARKESMLLKKSGGEEPPIKGERRRDNTEIGR